MSGKEKKKRREAPPLSTLDKGIYIALIIILLVLSAALAVDWSYWAARISGTWLEPVALRREGGDFLAVWFIVIAADICAFALYIKGIVDRTPILGNKAVSYGEYPWPKSLYPIFDERRRLYPVKAEKKRFWRGFAAVICLLLVLAFVFSWPVICRRAALDGDGTINAYNTFAKVLRYCPEDYEKAEFEIYEHSHRQLSYWTYKINVVCTDGRSYAFTREDMKEPAEALKTALELKQFLPENKFLLYNYVYLEKLLSEENIVGAEEALLRELFSQ